MKKKPHDKYLDKGLRGWIVETAKRNIWRMPSYIDIDDLIQDGFIAFLVCKEKYAHRVENRAHFMSLFKRVYMSRIVDMANLRSKVENSGVAEVAISQIAVSGRELTALEYLGGGIDGEAELICTLKRAPAEVKALLEAVQTGKLDAPRLPPRNAHGQFSKEGKRREQNGAFINRILGTVGIDYEALVREALA